MKIRVLGCHGSQLPNFNTTSFLIEKNILLDAGTVTTVLTPKEQMLIDYIFVTHAHLDHVRDIMFLADNLYYANRKKPLTVVSSRGIIDNLRRHLFNNVIWPDFSKIPSTAAPMLKFHAVSPGSKKQFGEFQVRALKLNHTVESLGFLVQTKNKAVLFLGDTGPTDNVWKTAASVADLKAIFLETSMPVGMQEAADKTGHLTPATLAAELKKIKGSEPDIYIHHMKPQYARAIRREITALRDRKIHIVKDAQVIHL